MTALLSLPRNYSEIDLCLLRYVSVVREYLSQFNCSPVSAENRVFIAVFVRFA
jgi:hypothetical protein